MLLEKQECNTVVFDIIIPLDLEPYPYYAFISTGIHTHPPPPPERLPLHIHEDIAAVVKRISSPGLTLCIPKFFRILLFKLYINILF